MDLIKEVNKNDIPQHIAIIMDGNRRWAKYKKLPKNYGHRAGMKRLREIIEISIDLNIKNITVYAFSTENWGRQEEEVNFLMNLLIEYLKKEINELHEQEIKINILGNLNDLPKYVRKHVDYALELTKNNNKMNFNIAISYGGRNEILLAIKKIINEYKNNVFDMNLLDEENFKKYLFTQNIPDPDLLIRTSGEIRLSNFLLYQIAYAELYFTDVLWPDFSKEEYLKAILNYQKRNRRYGKL